MTFLVRSFNHEVFNENQKLCLYSPCFCAYYGYQFGSSTKQLYTNTSAVIMWMLILCNSFWVLSKFSLTLYDHLNFLVLHENNKGTLFVLMNHCVKDLGNSVMLICIQPASCKASSMSLMWKPRRVFSSYSLAQRAFQASCRKLIKTASLLKQGSFYYLVILSVLVVSLELTIWLIGQSALYPSSNSVAKHKLSKIRCCTMGHGYSVTSTNLQ